MIMNWLRSVTILICVRSAMADDVFEKCDDVLEKCGDASVFDNYDEDTS